MGLTAFSIIVWPLCLLWAGSPSKLLKLMMILSVFEAAAAMTIGSFGVQPSLVPALMVIGYVTLQGLLGASFSVFPTVWALTRLLIFVVMWAIVTSFLMPRVFEGQVFVWPQKSNLSYGIALLAPNSANLNQDLYLVIDTVFLVTTVIYLAQARFPLAPFLKCYFYSGYIAAGVAVWQFASRVARLPFPESVFYSNPGWFILTGQQVGAVPRINGSFAEPSALAGYMASIVCATGWIILRGRGDRFARVLFYTGIATIAITTSTTGFAVLVLMLVGILSCALVTGSSQRIAAVAKLCGPVLLVGALITAVSSVLLPSFNSNVAQVISATLTKQDSESYEGRTNADIDSINAVLNTYGFGVGWGSNRSASLIPGLLTGIGIPGVLTLLAYVAQLIRQVRRIRLLNCSYADRRLLDGCCGGLAGYLLAAILSGPSITSIMFFFLLGLLVACTIRVQRAASRPLQVAAGQSQALGPDLRIRCELAIAQLHAAPQSAC